MRVFRLLVSVVAAVAWFSASPIPDAMLQDASGTPTDLGTTYASLAGECP